MSRTTIEVEPQVHASIKRIAQTRGTKVKALTNWMLRYALERIEHVFDQPLKGHNDNGK
jgi:hypothetical protein